MKFTRITVDPKQMNGVPCIRGLRIPVATVVGMLVEGMTEVEILRVPNIMNHVCVAARTDGSREGGRSSYREYEQAARQSEPPLWLQPFGLARILAHDFVASLVNIRDIHCGPLRVLSQNRASAARGSLC